MSSNIVNIQPVTISGTSFRLCIQEIELKSSARVSCYLYDGSNNLLQVNNFHLTGTDYMAWGSNDEYLMNYAANLYGYTIIPTTTTP
jgi:hypothetical protein